ncbi:MAG: hypothetical protein OIF55_14665 [Amphritea sp.]|nr:hypothetical protein [Amphritea sp.]
MATKQKAEQFAGLVTVNNIQYGPGDDVPQGLTSEQLGELRKKDLIKDKPEAGEV